MRSSAAGMYPVYQGFTIACKKAVLQALVQARVCVDQLMVSERGLVSRKRKTGRPEVALKAGNLGLSGNFLSESLGGFLGWCAKT